MTIWTLLDPWLPHVHVWWLDAFLKPVPPEPDEINELAARLAATSDPSRAAAAAEQIAAAETTRIDGLERKLDGQRTAATALAPFTAGVLTWGLAARELGAVVLTAIAAVYLVLSYLVAMNGTAARRRYLMGGSEFHAISDRADLGFLAAATRVLYARANENYAVRLNNYISMTQRSFQIALVLTIFGGLIFLMASQALSTRGTPSDPDPSPEALVTADELGFLCFVDPCSLTGRYQRQLDDPRPQPPSPPTIG